ncbi:hypothetical protein CDEN61S_03470 [Castellaniella denitrificans]
MRGGQCQQAGRLTAPVHAQGLGVDRQVDEGEIRPAFREGAGRHFVDDFLDDELLAEDGAEAVHPGQRLGQQAAGEIDGHQDPQGADLAAAHALDPRFQLVQVGQDAAHLLVELGPLCGQGDGGPGTGEQHEAQFGLQIADLAADDGLRTAQHAAGRRDAAAGHDGVQGLELAYFHDTDADRPCHTLKKPPRCAFGLLPPRGALFALGRPGGKKAPTLRPRLAAPQGDAFRLGTARRQKSPHAAPSACAH